MKLFHLIICALMMAQVATAGVRPVDVSKFDDQFAKSLNFMTQNMIRNDIAEGAIIAAPSKTSPDYFFHWVRDAALTVEAALEVYEIGRLNADQKAMLKTFFLNHINFNLHIQKTALKGGGLGEPKFSIDGQVYAYPWGRPQNDGPALRASSLTHILNLAVAEKWPEADRIAALLYEPVLPTRSLVKADLEFVSHNWQDLNFDLWEETYGAHFYTLLTQRKALAEGIQTANYYMDFGAARFYAEQLNRIQEELEKFWNPDRHYILATLWTHNQSKSHLDTAVVLGVLHASIEGFPFSFTDDRVIATFNKLREGFGQLYPINKDDSFGVAFGRYTEDTYDGYETNKLGNPWVLTTAGAAEFLYRTAAELANRESLQITTLNQNFYTSKTGIKKLRVGQVLTIKDPNFEIILQKLVTEGDRYLARVIYHRNSDGSLSEQINRYSGFMQGAPNLTWSHASFVTAKLARDRVVHILKQLKGRL